VCGDVGFGKTEIAVRAAFKAIQDGKQVAVLVPTTLLAQQHGNTFADRFAGFPVRVEVLSRFLTTGQAKKVIEGLGTGEVDLVIGTHRLLAEGLKFKDLGLLVVDEEQRFGVQHKESIKKLKTNVDVLTLTATPIPRTLEMSLVGIRDLSLLQTPPADRQPILTFVGEYDERVAVEAIRRELLREGQVFWVHNRVQTIEMAAHRLRELVPEARIAVTTSLDSHTVTIRQVPSSARRSDDSMNPAGRTAVMPAQAERRSPSRGPSTAPSTIVTNIDYLLAALGGMAWARRLGGSEPAALAAGLGFALSGFMVSSSDNPTYLTTMAAVPWLLAAAHAHVARGGPLTFAAVAAASFACAAGGDPQAFGFALGAVLLQRLVLGPRDVPPARAALRTATALAAAVAGAAPVLLPIAAWVPHSARGEPMDWVEYVRFNLHPARALELVVPHLMRPTALDTRSDVFAAATGEIWTPAPWVLSHYLGAVALALALVGAARRREARALLLLALAFTWMAMGHHGGFGQLARALPVLDGFRYWEKLAFWPALLVPAAAALGVDALRGGKPGHSPRALLAAALAVLAAALAAALLQGPLAAALQRGPEHAAAARQLADNAAEGLLHAGLLLALLAAVVGALGRRRPAALPAAAALLLAADLASANVRAYVLAPPEVVEAPSPFAERLRAEAPLPRLVTPFPLGHLDAPGVEPFQRAWLWGSRALYSGWNVGARVANFEAYSALIPVRGARYRRRAGLVKQLPGVGMWGVSHALVPGAPERAAEMNLPPPYHPVAADPALQAVLLEIRHRPRAYLAPEVATVDRRAAMEFALDDRSVSTERTVVEAPLPAGFSASPGDAAVVEDLPASVVVRTRSAGPALLVLNDAYAEGWRASVDGEPAEIVPANYLARGVFLPGGEHRVAFRYRTPLLLEGIVVAALCALAALGWAAARALRSGRSAADGAGSGPPSRSP